MDSSEKPETGTTGQDDGAALIFAVRAAEFEERVIKRSHEVPVLVDFWAPWCAPCRVLGPALEGVVRELGGRVVLAKVNTDQDQGLTQTFRISGIPAVKAFYKGRVVNEFVGARDARFIRSFLESILPQRGEAELDEASGLVTSRRFAEAEQLLNPLCSGEQAVSGELLEAVRVLRSEALIGLGELGEARALLSQVDPRSPQTERAEMLQKVLEFLRAADSLGGATEAARQSAGESGDPEIRFTLAAADARSGRYAEALERLLELVGGARSHRDRARQAMTTLFQYLGPDDELTHEYRRRLQVY